MTTFGWCLTAHHSLCRRTFTSPFGVHTVCACECHDGDEAA